LHASSQQAQRHGAGVGAPVQAQARVGNTTAQTDQPQVRVQTLKVRTGVGSGTHGQAGDGGQTQTIRSQAHRTTTITLQCHAHRNITIMKRSQAHQNITIRGQAQTITIQATRSLQHQERS